MIPRSFCFLLQIDIHILQTMTYFIKMQKKMSLVINVSVGSSVETSSLIYISSTFILYFPRLLLFLLSRALCCRIRPY